MSLKIPPLVLVALVAGLMGLGAWGLPGLTFPFPGRVPVAVALAAAGVLLSMTGVVCFRKAKTTVNPMSPESASALVVVGVYRWTRNPMYLGFLLMLGGLACFLSTAVAAALLPAFVVYMNRFQIRPEEAALEARFGPDFVAYRSRVRRWI